MSELLPELLYWLGSTVYGGSLFAFACLVLLRRRIAGSPEQVMRVYRAWGPGLGLAMGALILGGLWRHFLANGGFHWPLDTWAEQLTAAQHGLFLVLWVSSFHLEIWTLEPCRKLDGPGGVGDPTAYDRACRKVGLQLALNVALFIGCGVLGLLAA